MIIYHVFQLLFVLGFLVGCNPTQYPTFHVDGVGESVTFYSFGKTLEKEVSLQIRNNHSVHNMDVSDIDLSVPYEITSNTCLFSSVPPQQSCELLVKFSAPTGERQAFKNTLNVLYRLGTDQLMSLNLVLSAETKDWSQLVKVGGIWGQIKDVKIIGDRVYAAAGLGGLRILDISNPAMPTLIGTYRSEGNEVLSVTVRDHLAFVALGSAGMQILDVTNPSSPLFLSEVRGVLNGYTQKVDVLGEMAVLAEGNGGLGLVDISNPLQPIRKTSITEKGAALNASFIKPGYVAFLNTSGHLVTAIVFDSSRPAVLATYMYPPTGFSAQRLFIKDGFAYVGGLGQNTSKFFIIRLNDPRTPTLLGTYSPSGNVTDITVGYGIAFITTENLFNSTQTMEILDVANPSAPIKIGQHMGSGSGQKIGLDGNTIALHSNSGRLEIFDISRPDSPALLGRFEQINRESEKVQVSNNLLLALSSRNLSIFDLTNPSTPKHKADFYFQGETCSSFSVQGNRAYLGCSQKIRVIDFTAPTIPREIGSYSMGGSKFAIAVSDGKAFIASSTAGLVILDISNPEAINFLGSYSVAGGIVTHISVKEKVAYAAFGQSGLHIIDVSQPQTPKLLSVYTVPAFSSALSVAIRGGIAVLTLSSSTFAVLDVRDATSPKLLSHYYNTVALPTAGLTISGNLLFGSNSQNSIVVYNIANPMNPQLISSLGLPGGFDITIWEDKIISAHKTEGISIIDVRGE